MAQEADRGGGGDVDDGMEEWVLRGAKGEIKDVLKRIDAEEVTGVIAEGKSKKKAQKKAKAAKLKEKAAKATKTIAPPLK